MSEYLLTTWFTEYFKPTGEIYAQRKRFLSNYYCSLTMYLVTRELWWRCTMILMLFSCLLTQHPSQPMYQGIILTFKSYYLSNTFCKAIAAIDSDLADGSRQSQLKTWKAFTTLDAMKNICDSWEEVKISTLSGVQTKLIPTLTADFEEFKTQWRK